MDVPSKTKKFFYKINLIMFFFGMQNCWIEEVLSKRFERFYNVFNFINQGLVFILIGSEFVGFYTQNNLTEKQKSQQVVYGVSHTMLFIFFLLMSYQNDKVKYIMHNLVIRLKVVHNDLAIEKQMISKLKAALTAVISFCVMSLVLYTFEAIQLAIRTGTTFDVIFLGWPVVDYTSTMANVVRSIFYIIWMMLCSRVFSMYILVISMMTFLSYQYKNLQSYFYSIDDIFEERITQEEKEKKYEEAFRVGIKLHVDTLRCTKDCESICKVVFSGQIIFNTILMVVLLSQMVSTERTITNLGGVITSTSAILISTGFFMWNAGDVTVEASDLATAMYFSGWHNCMGGSLVRIRKMIIISMMNAQVKIHSGQLKPVVMKGLGMIVLSYQSYVSIVKSAYSVFSVIY